MELLLHRVSLNIESHSPRILGWIGKWYTSYHNPQQSRKTSHHTLKIEELDSRYRLPILLPKKSSFTGIEVLGWPCYFADKILFSRDPVEHGHELSFDLSDRSLLVNVGGRLTSSEEAFIYGCLKDLLKKIIFPFNGYAVIHAAAVTKNNSRTVCLLGNGGAGKSTAALSLLQDGFQIISDNNPLLCLQAGRAFVLSSLDDLSVTEHTVDMLPGLRTVLGRRREGSGKFSISPMSLGQRAFSFGPLAPTHLVSLVRQDCHKPRVGRLPKQLILATLLRESLVLFSNPDRVEYPAEIQEVNDIMFGTIMQLVDQCQVFQVVYANHHLRELPNILESI